MQVRNIDNDILLTDKLSFKINGYSKDLIWKIAYYITVLFNKEGSQLYPPTHHLCQYLLIR